MESDITEHIFTALENLHDSYTICGMIDQVGNIYPLGADTKVLSTAFELVCRPAIYKVANILNYSVVEPNVQNHYPDFTLMRGDDDDNKIAVDVKTTYRRKGSNRFGYTLGGYTSFIRIGNEEKNIVFPFHQYARHLVIGFVYDRITDKKASVKHKVLVDELASIPSPIANIEFFVQDKWRISSDRAGSGNTTNIGSINGTIDDFREGRGVFASEDEFLEYWRGYKRTARERTNFSNIKEFRLFNQR